jgi:hypothetical protein
MASLTDRFDSLFGVSKNLKRLETSVNTVQFFDEIFETDGSLKFKRPSDEWPHREAFHIFLRVPRPTHAPAKRSVCNVTDSVDTSLYAYFPKLTMWIDAFAKRRRGRVQRVIIAALAPHGQIYRHADRGWYFAARDRYHLVIQSDGGTMLIAGQEAVLTQGEVWWINNKVGHQSFNGSNSPRIHLIVDLLPQSFAKRSYNVLFWFYFGLRPKRFTNYWINWPQRFQATS